jgi:hypothetical protein
VRIWRRTCAAAGFTEEQIIKVLKAQAAELSAPLCAGEARHQRCDTLQVAISLSAGWRYLALKLKAGHDQGCSRQEPVTHRIPDRLEPRTTPARAGWFGLYCT